jgi:cold shock CspA family protein
MWHSGQSLSASKVPKQPSLFFSSAIPIKQLHELGNIGEVKEEDESPAGGDTRQRLRVWLSKSAQNKAGFTAVDFHEGLKASVNKIYEETLPLEHTPPPPGFEPVLRPSPQVEPPKANWSDYSLGANFTPTPTSNLQFIWEILPESEAKAKEESASAPPQPDTQPHPKPEVADSKPIATPPVLRAAPASPAEVQLRLPPKKQKRVERCKFTDEELQPQRVRGVLKFYHLKKRFGFVTAESDGSDIFICEDDIVLSGLNFKQFKEDVANGLKPLLEFAVKVYCEKDKEKKKAVDIVSLGCVE